MRKSFVAALVAGTALLGMSAVGTAQAATVTPDGRGGTCQIHASGKKGIESLTEHVDTNTCDVPVAAWVECHGLWPLNGTYWSQQGSSISGMGDIFVECGGGTVVFGGYTYQPTYNGAWVSVQNT
jgi:hypothetical protein